MYHKTLYVLFFTALAFLFLQSVGGKSPAAVGRYLMAQVGMTASTPPNQYNSLAQQLLDKQNRLDEKEKTLSEKEAILAAESKRESQILLYLAVIAGILLALILVNYYLDWISRRKVKAASAVSSGKEGEIFKIY